jgi:DNA ligase (NAD+)
MATKAKKATFKDADQIEAQLRAAAEAYYNNSDDQDAQLMTNQQFDELKLKWEFGTGRKFEVGAKPLVSATTEMAHGFEDIMGTLDKVNSVPELRKWLESKKLPQDETVVLGCSIKYDGHSVLKEFKNNRLAKAMTRGQDGVGKDLTGYFKKARAGQYNYIGVDVPGGEFAVSFEAVISWDNLAKLNEEFGTSYNNPRSAIGGIIKEDGVEMAKYLTLIPLKFRIKDQELTRQEELEWLAQIIVSPQGSANFEAMDYDFFELDEDMEPHYTNTNRDRVNMPYMIDGLVIEILNQDIRDELGYSDDRPNFARALKFPYIERETKAKSVEWFTEGNSAIYTPVVHFEPLKINNNTYKQTSIANYGRFMEMELHPGDRMVYQLRNDVLGWLDKLVTEGNKKPLFQPPTHCEYCDEPLQHDDVFLFCANEECDLVKIGNIQQLIDKTGIKGIQRATIEGLYCEGLIEKPADLLNLSVDAIAKVEGFGKASGKEIVDAIQTRLVNKGLKDWELLGAMNIWQISGERAKLLLSRVSLSEMVEVPSENWIEKFVGLAGVKEKTVDALLKGIELRREAIKSLIYLVNSSSTKTVGAAAEIPDGPKYKVVITGALKHYKDREDFKNAVEAVGHKVSGSISKNTDFLITNDTTSGTQKNEDARKLAADGHRIRIITENEAIELLGVNKRAGEKVALTDAFE